MKKLKTPKLNVSIALLITGSAIILLTPAIKELLGFLFTKDCPVLWGKIECGLDKGLVDGTAMMGLLALWFMVGIVVLVAGLVGYFNTKQRR